MTPRSEIAGWLALALVAVPAGGGATGLRLALAARKLAYGEDVAPRLSSTNLEKVEIQQP